MGRRGWRFVLLGLSFLVLAQGMAWGQTCPPQGSTTITSCCDYGLNPAPCGIQVPRLYLKSVVPPSVTPDTRCGESEPGAGHGQQRRGSLRRHGRLYGGILWSANQLYQDAV